MGGPGWRGRTAMLRLYRAAVVVLVALLIHIQADWRKQRRSLTVNVEQAGRLLPGTVQVRLLDAGRGYYYAFDQAGERIGVLLLTSPWTDGIVGYSGPNNVLVALDTNGVVAGVELLRSGDTEEHVALVRKASGFLAAFVGWSPGDSPPPIEGVSGATLTSQAIAEGIQTRLTGSAPSLRFPDPVRLEEARHLLAGAASLEQEGRRWRVMDGESRLLGYIVRTSPEADNVGGYRGPTEALVSLAVDGRTVTGVRLRGSYDTESYVEQVSEDEFYLRSFAGRTAEELAVLDYDAEQIEGVSGATETSFAVAEGLKRRFASSLRPDPGIGLGGGWGVGAWGLVAVVLGACLMAFTSLRGFRMARLLWQAILVGYVGLVGGNLLSLDLLVGWAGAGVAWESAPGLVLLAGAALVIPWVSGRQLYCHHVCPHGALQQWIGAAGRRMKLRRGVRLVAGRAGKSPIIRSRVLSALEGLPVVLLAVAWVSVLAGLPLRLARLEPFDAWVWRAAGGVTIVIAIVGLVGSFFLPQAYCRYGCPTGALLNFLRHRGSADRWGRRDSVALILLGMGVMAVVISRA